MDYEILLHPYRFLIVAALGEKDATIKELRGMLPDIPQAAIYRGIQKLEEAKLVKRISEKKVRGAVEATFRLNVSLEKMKLEDNSADAYLNAAYAVFFSYVHHKLAEHNAKPSKDDNLWLSKFNTIKIRIKRDSINEFAKATANLLQEYNTEDGDSYQLTTFLVPENGEE